MVGRVLFARRYIQVRSSIAALNGVEYQVYDNHHDTSFPSRVSFDCNNHPNCNIDVRVCGKPMRWPTLSFIAGLPPQLRSGGIKVHRHNDAVEELMARDVGWQLNVLCKIFANRDANHEHCTSKKICQLS